ncbi:MAG: Gfo/Idh/MocA family oxidoreductase [Clostridiales bacterium]|jgi:predicted dehydrogenase|nr:Gfo/Idh/MocA family oxidoreductase [Clostridiales bacterium]
MLKCAIIGFGGLGKLHYKNLAELEKEGEAKAIAVCDVDEKQYTYSRIEINLDVDLSIDSFGLPTYLSAQEMILEQKPDFVISATPTYIHQDIAALALSLGVNVFSEKPMALTIPSCDLMLEASRASGKLLMIGQCLRYWPEYAYLKELIDSRIYGEVERAEFIRYGSFPKWSWNNWFADHDKSGGSAIDLHVHDVDMINWLFGPPKSVSSQATHRLTPYDSISTLYSYPGKIVFASAEWGMPDTYPFHMGFLVRFEKATVSYNAGVLKIFEESGVSEPVLSKEDAYKSEIKDFIKCINEGKKIEINPPEDSKMAVQIALAEKESAAKGVPVCIQI